MEKGFNALEAKQRTKAMQDLLPPLVPENLVDVSSLVEKRIDILATKQVENIHKTIEQTIESKTGVSNVRYVYNIELSEFKLNPELEGHYATIMDEVATVVLERLKEEGFICTAFASQMYDRLQVRYRQEVIRLDVIFLVAWV